MGPDPQPLPPDLVWTSFGPHFVGGFQSRIRSELSGPMRDTPPPYRAIPFRDSIADGGIARFCLVFIGYRASIAEIPLLRGGVSHLHFACSPRGETLRKAGGGGYRTQLAMLRRQKLVGVLRGNTIRGNTTRNSERKMAL